MKVILENNINYNIQIDGMGDVTTTFSLAVNLSSILDTSITRQFILALTIVANGRIYYYTNIYSTSDIESNGNLIVGDMTVIGDVDQSNINISANITYLNAPN